MTRGQHQRGRWSDGVSAGWAQRRMGQRVRRMGMLGLGLVAAVSPPTAHGATVVTHLVRNGSFEAPVTPSGSYQMFSLGQRFSGWKVVGASGNVAVVSGAFTQNGYRFPAEGGAQWLDLTGASNTPTGVAQTIPTTVGGAYTLVFYVGNVDNTGGLFGATSRVNVLVNDTRVFTAKNARGQGQTTLVWQKFTTTITARSAHTTISFINGDPPSDGSNGLDAISLVPARPRPHVRAHPHSR